MPKIVRTPLSDQVTDAIVELIENDKIAVGSVLPPAGELATRFGVSVVVVREALATLAGRGIVRRGQGKEPIVTRPGGEVLDSIFRTRMRQDGISLDEFQECRASLEGQSAAEAARHPEHAQALTALQPHLDTMARSVSEEDFVAADLAFHLTLAGLSGNRALVLLLEGLNTFVQASLHVMYDRIHARGGQALADAVRAHEKIAHAVTAGDPDAAIIAMRGHFEASSPHLVFDINPHAPGRT